jgi:hypothetical protein
MTQHHIPEDLNQQLYSCETPANFFRFYKDETIIPHLRNNFLYFFTSPMKPENVQNWKKYYFFIFKQPLYSVIILIILTFTLHCLSTQNLILQLTLQVVHRRDISNHINYYVPNTLLRMR